MGEIENNSGAINQEQSAVKGRRGFRPGISGNPGGRPAVIGPFREACQKFIQEEGGWQRIVEFAMMDDNPKIALEALKLMVQYGIGRPPESVTFSPNLNIATLDVKGLDSVLLKAINGDIQLSKEQLAALRMALQKSGSLPDPFTNGFKVTYGNDPEPKPQEPGAAQ